MRLDQAVEVLAFTRALWPGMRLPDTTAKMWGNELLEHDFAVATAAMVSLAHEQSRPPGLADILRAIHEERAAFEAPALPEEATPEGISFEDFLAQNPEM